MEQKSARQIQQELALPFAPEDLEWRLQQAYEDKMRGLAVPYVTNRAIQNRLDEVVGPDNWYNDFKPWHGAGKKEAQLCGIAIYFESRKEWITKWDGAEDSDIEPVKGGLSDSMKRCAVQWGIGRVLYSMDTVWVEIEKRGKSYIIKDSERPRLDKAYLGMLQRLGLTPAPAGGLQSLLTPKGTPEAQTPKQPTAAAAQQTGGKAPQTVQTAPVQARQPQAMQTPQPVLQPAPAAPTQPEIPAAPPASMPTPQATYEYVVLDTKIQGGMSGSSTLVTMEALDGKRIQAFARGARPELRAGTMLTGVRLSVRKQDTVAYYVLEGYELVCQQSAA